MSTPTTVPGLDRDTAMRLAAEEVRRYADLLDKLDEEQWAAATECEPWTVRDMAGHVLGNHEGLLSLQARARQTWRARRHGGNLVDAMSATQIAKRAHHSPSEVVSALRAAGPASVAARLRVPKVLRALRVTVPMHQGDERWSLAYLDDIIYTRDTWMHRMDMCAALDIEPELTVAHDGVIVADIVREWELRHFQPFRLTLQGPAGGDFGSSGGEPLALDAVEFCRLLSGRGHGEGLLAVEVGY
jgi:uncharacterized protein (TIGR03083 family)